MSGSPRPEITHGRARAAEARLDYGVGAGVLPAPGKSATLPPCPSCTDTVVQRRYSADLRGPGTCRRRRGQRAPGGQHHAALQAAAPGQGRAVRDAGNRRRVEPDQPKPGGAGGAVTRLKARRRGRRTGRPDRAPLRGTPVHPTAAQPLTAPCASSCRFASVSDIIVIRRIVAHQQATAAGGVLKRRAPCSPSIGSADDPAQKPGAINRRRQDERQNPKHCVTLLRVLAAYRPAPGRESGVEM